MIRDSVVNTRSGIVSTAALHKGPLFFKKPQPHGPLWNAFWRLDRILVELVLGILVEPWFGTLIGPL